MIRHKLIKGMGLCLGLALAVGSIAHIKPKAEAYGTGITKNSEHNLNNIDEEYLVSPEVFINAEQLNSSDVKVKDGTIYLPLETVTYKMGDILEGEASEGLTLRKEGLLIINPSGNSYSVNGENKDSTFIVEDGKAYAPISFYKDVLNYMVFEDGNRFQIGNSKYIGANPDIKLDDIIDEGMLINPEIFVNGEMFPEFAVKVNDGVIYLPLEAVSARMGNVLEGDAETGFLLRTDGKLINIIPSESKYKINDAETGSRFFNENGMVYAPLDLFKDVFGYTIKVDGNSYFIGGQKQDTFRENTYPNGVWETDGGKWIYINNGEKVTGWVLDNNVWYYMNDEGIMQTGWILVNGKWYFLNDSGAMQTGWILDKGNYYYLKPDGSMAANEIVDGFSISDTGLVMMPY